MSHLIRDAGVEDIHDIVEFNCRLARETEDKALDREVLGKGVAALLADPQKGRYWLAAEDDSVVGQIMTTREWSDWRNGVFWWIQSVYVRDTHRGRGVFSALYRHVEKLARNDPEVCGLRLYVETSNRRARQIYAALGMSEAAYRVMEIEFGRRHASEPEE